MSHLRGSLRQARTLLSNLQRCAGRPQLTGSRLVHSTTTSPDDPSRTKRPSPYRLIPLATFLASFAPLHVKGWRLVPLPSTEPERCSTCEPAAHAAPHEVWPGDIKRGEERGVGDLEGKRLVRLYELPQGRDGWTAVKALCRTMLQAIEEENHHPSLNISPASDYRPTHTALQRPDAATGYVIEISSHTHTPLPTLKSKVEAAQTTTIGQSVETKPAPGVTGKDLKLAERLEAAYEDIMGTKAES